jgi:hypothetical protein
MHLRELNIVFPLFCFLTEKVSKRRETITPYYISWETIGSTTLPAARTASLVTRLTRVRHSPFAESRCGDPPDVVVE